MTTESPDFPRPFDPRATVYSIVAMLAGLALIPFAETAFGFYYPIVRNSGLDDLFAAAKNWASLTVYMGILATIWFLDPARRKFVIVLLVANAMTSICVETIKHTAGRSRPEYGVRLKPEDGGVHLKEMLASNPNWNFGTERGDKWLGLRLDRPFFEDEFASFPSGHSAGGFVLAAYLSLLYPKGKLIWLFFAVACALARVRFRRHLMDDVLFGGGLGWIVAHWVFSWRWPVALGERLASAVNYPRIPPERGP